MSIGDFFGDLFGWIFQIPEPETETGLLLNKEGTNRAVPVVYGQRKVGGIRYFYATGDKPSGNNKKNAYLYVALVLCEGEIESIDEIWLDDRRLDEFDSSDVSYSTYGGFSSYTDETPIVIRAYLGSDTQTSDAMLQAHPDWTSSHVGKGLAYLACRFKVSERLFSKEPTVTATIRGKKVKDIRTSPVTEVYTDNAALCLRDYLTNARYGKGLSESLIDDTLFAAAADDCDTTETVASQVSLGSPDSVYVLGTVKYMLWNSKPADATILAGTTITNGTSPVTKTGTVITGGMSSGYTGYTSFFTLAFEMVSGSDFTTADTIYIEGDTTSLFACNAVLTADENNTVFDNVKRIMAGCRGNVPHSQGKYGLLIEKARASSLSLTKVDVIGGISVELPKKSARYNKVTVRFDNPNKNWQQDMAIFPEPGSATETTLLAEDGNTPLPYDITLDTVTNYYQARDLARIILYKSRANILVTLSCRKTALQASVGDVIDLTDPLYGWSAKEFTVVGMGLLADGNVSLRLEEYTSSIYTYDGTDPDLLADNTDLPNPLTVEAPANLSAESINDTLFDKEIRYGIRWYFDASDDAFLDEYEIQYKESTDTIWKSVFTREAETTVIPLDFEINYDARVRAISTLGIKSDWSPDETGLSHNLAEDTTPPGLPTSIIATAGDHIISVSFTPPTAVDRAFIYVYYNTVNSIPAVHQQTETYLANDFTITGLQPDQQYYIWLKSVDDAGNVSAATAPVTATTTSLSSPTGLAAASINDTLFDNTIRYGLQVTFTGVGAGYSYEIQYKLNTDTDWIAVFTEETSYNVIPLDWDKTYDIRCRALGDRDKVSPWSSTIQQTVAKDTTAPGLATAVTLTPEDQAISVEFAPPSDIDLRHFEVFYNTVNSIPATPAFEHVALSTQFVIGGLSPNTTYYVWLKSVDDAGNVSAATASVSTTTTNEAGDAQSTADGAQTAADDAQTAADNAQTAADNAQATATSKPDTSYGAEPGTPKAGDIWVDKVTTPGLTVPKRRNDGNTGWDQILGDAGTADLITNNLLDGTTALNQDVVLGTLSQFRTSGKTSFSDTSAGLWLGYDAGAYKFNFGDADEFISWDGSALSISNVTISTAGDTIYASIGIGELANDGLTTGLRNIGIGGYANWRVTDGLGNCAFGYAALQGVLGSSSGLNYNVGLGYSANSSIAASTERSIAIGHSPSATTDGIAIGYLANAAQTGAVAIGRSSGVAGVNGVGVGYNSDVSGNYAVCIGSNQSAAANKLVVHSASAAASYPLISGDFSAADLTLNGDTTISADAAGSAGDLTVEGNINANVVQPRTGTSVSVSATTLFTGAISATGTISQGGTAVSLTGHTHAAGDITSGTLAVARGGTGVTSSTGTGSVVLSNSPVFGAAVDFGNQLRHAGDTDTAIKFETDNILLTVAAVDALDLTSSVVECNKDTVPRFDSTYSLGSSTKLWTEVWADNSTIQTSDEREKTIHGEIGGRFSVDVVRELEWISYDRINTPGIESWGVSAQQFAGVLRSHGIDPAAVSAIVYSPGVDRYSMRYTELIAILGRALQEAWEAIDAQAAYMDEILERLAVVEQAVNSDT